MARNDPATMQGRRMRMKAQLRDLAEDIADMVATRNRMAEKWGQRHPKVIEIEEDITFWQGQRVELLRQRDLLKTLIAAVERATAERLAELKKGA